MSANLETKRRIATSLDDIEFHCAEVEARLRECAVDVGPRCRRTRDRDFEGIVFLAGGDAAEDIGVGIELHLRDTVLIEIQLPGVAATLRPYTPANRFGGARTFEGD